MPGLRFPALLLKTYHVSAAPNFGRGETTDKIMTVSKMKTNVPVNDNRVD